MPLKRKNEVGRQVSKHSHTHTHTHTHKHTTDYHHFINGISVFRFHQMVSVVHLHWVNGLQWPKSVTR